MRPHSSKAPIIKNIPSKNPQNSEQIISHGTSQLQKEEEISQNQIYNSREYATENLGRRNTEMDPSEESKYQLGKLMLKYELQKMGFNEQQYSLDLQSFTSKHYSTFLLIPLSEMKFWVQHAKSEVVDLILKRNNKFSELILKKSETVNVQQSNVAQENQNVGEGPVIFCSICYVETNKYLPRKCQHLFCNPCMRSYIAENISSGQFLISCPQYQCQQLFTNEEAKTLLDELTFEKYLRFKQKTEQQNNPNNKFCSQPDCGQILIKNEHSQEMLCPTCKIRYCPLCFQLFHPNRDCSQMLESAINAIYHKYEIKRCPKCCSPIQKIDGCNHMTCKKCKADFCWICLRQIGNYHYRIYNCCGCPGMQFDQPEQICCKRLAMIIFFIFLPLLLTLIIGGVLAMLPLYISYFLLINPCRWLNQQSNPKLQLKFLNCFCFCNFTLAIGIKHLIGYLLFMPRSVLYAVFIAPIKYFIGVYEAMKEMI